MTQRGKEAGNPEEDRRFRVAFWSALILGVALYAVAFALSSDGSEPHPLIIEVGKAGASLAIVVVIGGLVREAFQDRDAARRKREALEARENAKAEEELAFYRGVLADFKSVYDSVERCRLLVEAHKSAKTYGEQIRALSDAVITLHNVRRALDPEFPRLKAELDPHITGCSAFIKDLIAEFRDNYISISRQQSVDEALNKHRREALAVKGGDTIEVSHTAWDLIARLPRLEILRSDEHHGAYHDAFVSHIDAASALLRRRIPVSERPA